ncbi:hypothetical protein Q3G72_016563 [Acer saccharum]|nr:hypothetical protein Q3G72_016563 [Acer saccharum]
MSIPLLDCMIPDPEDGFPTNLTSLDVGGANICKAFFEWGLHRLTSLKFLAIHGGCPDMISFPMLPTSLTTLLIYDFRDLERLSPNFQDHTSLKESFQQKFSDRSTDKVREVLKLDQEMRDLSVQSYWFEGVLEVKEVRVGVPQVQA